MAIMVFGERHHISRVLLQWSPCEKELESADWEMECVGWSSLGLFGEIVS